jgi:hypothetical protein
MKGKKIGACPFAGKESSSHEAEVLKEKSVLMRLRMLLSEMMKHEGLTDPIFKIPEPG